MLNAFAPGKPEAALLASYWYLDMFLKVKDRIVYRDWVMDSGAFSAWRSGVSIDLDEYIETCKELLAKDPKLTEVYSLDVIGDWRAGMKNLEYMHSKGVFALPTYHIGEPESLLMTLARDYPKIALGGVANVRGKAKHQWIQQCFGRIWPKKVHGFAVTTETDVMAAPWHSVDSTTWVNPQKYGDWRSMWRQSATVTMGKRVRMSNKDINFRSEIDWFLQMEKRAQARWAKQMKELEELTA